MRGNPKRAGLNTDFSFSFPLLLSFVLSGMGYGQKTQDRSLILDLAPSPDGQLVGQVRNITGLGRLGKWDFDEGGDNWRSLHGCSLSMGDGTLEIQANEIDPYIGIILPQAIRFDRAVLQIRAKCAANGPGQLFWTTKQLPEYSENRSVGFDLTHDGKWHEYSVYFRPEGDLTSLRLDPGTGRGLVEIDWIKLGQMSPVRQAQVVVRKASSADVFATRVTDSEGSFQVDVSDLAKPGSRGKLDVIVKSQDRQVSDSPALSEFYFLPYRYRPTAKQVAGLKKTQIKLDGAWRINPSPPNDFCTHSTDGPEWSKFIVPGQWCQQGHEIPRGQTVGVATDFGVPESWKGKRLFLRFDAVHAGTHYWLNGHELGYSENLFEPVEFDVTDMLLPGKSNNLVLAMKVDTASEKASYSCDYAMHNLGGIDRSVRIFALPYIHLSSFHYETLLDSSYINADLSLSFDINNTTGEHASQMRVVFKLTDPDGKSVDIGPASTLRSLAPGITHFDIKLPVANPLKWNAEKPYLYKLEVELYRNSVLLERFERNVGFRQLEIRDSQLWLNGKIIKLAGINRHEIDPLTGRADTMRHAEVDARLLKDANFNYVRTSHYPPTREFLDACDRIGLYVEAEAPFCWTRGGRGEDDPKVTKHFLKAAAGLVEYNRNHPSVIMWSLGNESGTSPDGENRLRKNFAAMLSLCRREDASRPIIFSNEWNKDGRACDISVLHYAEVPLGDNKWVKDDPRPVLINEYYPPQTFTFAEELKLDPGLDIANWSSGQNSPTSWWSQVYTSKRLVGGAVWAGIDEEFYFANKKDTQNDSNKSSSVPAESSPENDLLAVGLTPQNHHALVGDVKGYGPWGFVDVWRRPKSLHWDAKRIFSPIWIPIRRLNYKVGQKKVLIPIENRYSFTDLREINISWEIGARQGTCKISLPPRSAGTVAIPIPANVSQGDLLVLRFRDRTGKLITAHGVRLGELQVPESKGPKAGCPLWQDDGKVVSVRMKDGKIEIAKATGQIIQEEVERSIRLLKLPTIFVTRQETRNAFNPGGLPYAQYPDQSTRVIDSIAAEDHDGALAITVRDHFEGFAGTITFLLDKEGSAKVSFDYRYSGQPFTRSELGLRFLFDRHCQEIRWCRRSEWDVYPEDHIGRSEGRALARIDKKWRKAGFPPYLSRPSWSWCLDENQFGTRDFRATKYHIYEAKLLASDGSGIQIDSDGRVNVRANLSPEGVQFHTLLSSRSGKVETGAQLSGSFTITLLFPKR